MYFLDELHEKNYKHMIASIIKNAKNSKEYHSLAYIFSLPDIYHRCIKDPMFQEFPLLWLVKYEEKSYWMTDEDEEYFVNDFEIFLDKSGNEIRSEEFNTLSSGYQEMVKLAANLFSSTNDEFNLMSGLGKWDSNLLKVYHQATSLRLNRSLVAIS